MKTMVVYQSSTGFTKQYAEWIASELGVKAENIKSVKSNDMEKYDFIIYGGWLSAGKIMGLNKLKKMNPKHIIVFGVGSAPIMEDSIKKLSNQNGVSEKECFYMPGGIRYEKLGFIYRNMLKAFAKTVDKKKNKTEIERDMAEHLKSSYDISDKRYIEDLIKYIRSNQYI